MVMVYIENVARINKLVYNVCMTRMNDLDYRQNVTRMANLVYNKNMTHMVYGYLTITQGLTYTSPPTVYSLV